MINAGLVVESLQMRHTGQPDQITVPHLIGGKKDQMMGL